MSKLNLKLISHTMNPELVIATAGKLCYSSSDINDLIEKQTPEMIEKFVGMLTKIGHESPLEHATFTFAVEGISRACANQIVRHRIASFSQQSQRYVKLNQFEYIIPAEIENIPQAKEIFIKAMEEDQKTYDNLVEILFEKHYEDEYARLFYLREQQGMELSEKDIKSINSKAEKKAIEDARYVFPNACETKMVFTMNLRTLINFCHHRCCRRAQDEINNLAWSITDEVTNASKLLGGVLGANCQFGKCPEGNMTCGMPYPKK